MGRTIYSEHRYVLANGGGTAIMDPRRDSTRWSARRALSVDLRGEVLAQEIRLTHADRTFRAA
jgi:hypothetical protein